MDLISIAVDLLNIQQNYKYYLDFKKLKENGYERIVVMILKYIYLSKLGEILQVGLKGLVEVP